MVKKMGSLTSRFFIVFFLFWVLHGFEIDQDCLHKFGEGRKQKSWNLSEILQVEFFIANEWVGNYHLEITNQNQTLLLELTFVSSLRGNSTSLTKLNLKPREWSKFLMKYDNSSNFVTIYGKENGPIGGEFYRPVSQETMNNVVVTLTVQKPDYMYFFLNCNTNERIFLVPKNGSGFLPVSFYMNRTRFVLYSKEEFNVILNGAYSNTRRIYLCKNFVELENATVSPYCDNEFSKNTDYPWDLSLSDANQLVIKEKIIKIESDVSPFYVKTSKSFNETWWTDETEELPEIDCNQPLIIVSSVFSAILIAGVIIFCSLYQRKKDNSSVKGPQLQTEGANLLQILHPPPLPPFPRPDISRGPKSHNHADEANWKIYKPPPIGPAPPLPEPLVDDGNVTEVYPGYGEPEWWAEKYGDYINPKVL